MSEARIRSIQQPTLLLWGRNDEIIPPATADKWKAALGQRCKLVWVEKAGALSTVQLAHGVASWQGSV